MPRRVCQLIVNPPSVTETVAVAPRNVGYLWHDSLYTTGGSHSRSSTTTDGCDHIDILYLTILDANCPDEEICQGDSVRLTVDAVLAAGSGPATSLPRYARPGDVLCTDGSLLAVDSFLVTGKSPKGVVFHVDETGMHGLAVALTEVDRAFMHSTPQLFLSSTYFSWSSAANDFNGEDNTLNLRTIDDAYASAEFTSDAIAASYCHFYNHNTLTADGESHGWYLPSFGELNLMLGNLWDVKQTLNRLKTVDNSYKSFESSSYWSSTLRDKDNAWFRSASSWYQGNLSMINGVRPITKF